MTTPLLVSLDDTVTEKEVTALYRANEWSSADNPATLLSAINNAHSKVTARQDSELVGISYAISDGHLVVYYAHMLVHPAHQGLGIGKKMMQSIQQQYQDFHLQVLTSEAGAVEFYKKVGFERASDTTPMWIYKGTDH